jgi:ATP-binding cassette, subfamily B, bacterial PglK
VTRTIGQLWGLLTPPEKGRSVRLALLMLLSSAIEVSGVLSVVPLVAVMTSATDPCLALGDTASAVCSRMLPSRNPYVLALIAFGLIALSNLLAFCVTWLSASLTWSVWRRLSTEVLANYLRKPYEFFFHSHSSTIVKNIVHETERLSRGVLMPMLIVASRVVVTLGIVLLVVVVNPALSLVIFLLLAAVYLLAYRRVQSPIRRTGELAFSGREQIGRIATESITGVRELRMLDCGPQFSATFGRAADSLARQYVAGVALGVMPRYLIETLAFALVLGLAVYLSQSFGGWQSAAPLFAFYVFAAYRLLPQFQQIFANAMSVYENARLAEALAEVAGPQDVSTDQVQTEQRPAVELRPPVKLDSVTYSYPGTSSAVLDKASMEIPARSTVGLVGATGEGKSTVIDLIAGLLEPGAGAITLNGTRLDAGFAPAWRTRIGYVPQVPFLLDDTIRRNIAFGLPDEGISQQGVERAARLANIHDFIASLPQGYETPTGERGVRLSGGQRQRLVIARALYRDPEMLIFDEATSALDQETEQAVMEAIRTLAHKKTLLIISHRPATLEGCDLVYEVADGKITLRQPAERRSSA